MLDMQRKISGDTADLTVNYEIPKQRTKRANMAKYCK